MDEVLPIALAGFLGLGIGFPAFVLDAQTHEAISGAWVVARQEECIGIAHCNTACIEVHVSRTDAIGMYVKPFRSEVIMHKEGYWEDVRSNGDRFLSRIPVDRRSDNLDPATVRIRYLAGMARGMSCFAAPRWQRAELLPVLKDLFAEAQRISRLPEQRQLAQAICHEMFWLTVSGSDPSPTTDAAERAYLEKVEPACVARPPDDSRRQAVAEAILRGDAAAVEKAVASGFDAGRPLNDAGDPAVVMATRAQRASVIAALSHAGVPMDAAGPSHRSALGLLMSGELGHPGRPLDVLEALLQGRADPNRPDTRGVPPLIRAAEADDLEVFAILRRHGAGIDVRKTCIAGPNDCAGRGESVLHVARDAKIARVAIEQGADVNARDGMGQTPLMRADNAEIARLLIDDGAEVDAVTQDNWTPLMFALRNCDSFPLMERYGPVAELLVKAGARLDATNGWGRSALDYAKYEPLKARLRQLAAERER